MFPTISGINLFPSDDIPFLKKKEKEYGEEVARAVYSRLIQSQTMFSVSAYTNFGVLRQYAAGEQDTTELVSWNEASTNTNGMVSPAVRRIDGQGIDNTPIGMGSGDLVRGKRRFNPVDYQVVSPMAKVISTIVSLIMNEANYAIQCRSINPSHVKQKNEQAWALYYRQVHARVSAETMGLMFPSDEFEPKSEQQVQIMLKQGYFRLLFESAFESVVNHTFEISDFDRISEYFIRDLAVLNFACGKKFFCTETGATKIKYVDPAKFVIQWNNDHEGRQPTYVGHIEEYSMYVVKKKMIELGYSMKEVKEVAKSVFNNYYNTTTGWPSNMWREKDPTGRWVWEDLKAQVLEFEYVTVNEVRYVKGENGGYDLIETPNQKSDTKDIKPTIYRGLYILGTNYLMDWEEMPNNCGEVSYFYSRVQGASVVQRSKSILDDIMKLVVKYRQEVWSAAPSGAAIDLPSIANIPLNPEQMQEFIQQALAAYRQTGTILTSHIIKQGKTINITPITPLENGPQHLEKYANQIAIQFNMVLDVSGIPQILAATPTVSSEKAVGIGEIEVISAGHAMYPLKRAFLNLKEFASRIVLNQIRTDIRFDKNSRDYYEGVLSEAQMVALDEVKDLSSNQLATTLKAMPNIKQKQEKKAMLLAASQAGMRDGLQTLTEGDLLYCYRLIDEDQSDLAEMYAVMKIDERKAAYDARQSQAAAENAELQAVAAERAEAAKQATLKMEIELAGLVKERLLMMDKQTPSAEIAQKGLIESQQIDQEGAWQAATGQNIKNPRN